MASGDELYVRDASGDVSQHTTYGALTATVDAHIADTSDAHDASAVSITDAAGNYTATDVEGALAELPSRYAPRPAVDGSAAEVLAIASLDPLVTEWVAGGGGGSGANLTWTAATSTVASDTGTDATLTAVDATNPGLMTVAQKTKLDGIAAGATTDATVDAHLADTTDAHDASAVSVADTGALYTATDVEAALAEVKTVADAAVTPAEAAAGYQPLDADLTALAAAGNSAVLAATTASFLTADETKLDGIEAGADVTDTANVTAAGALMDSEVTNLAAVKAFDPAAYATATQGALADTATQPADLANYVAKATFPSSLSIALSDMTTQITTGATKAYWVNPYDTTLTITKVKATLATAGSGATVVDINEGAGAGTTILSTKITIDASGTDSDAAGIPPVVSDSSIAADGRLTFDIDTAGTSAAGLMVHIMFTRAV